MRPPLLLAGGLVCICLACNRGNDATSLKEFSAKLVDIQSGVHSGVITAEEWAENRTEKSSRVHDYGNSRGESNWNLYVSQEIRRALMADKFLSPTAKQVRISAHNGRVVLSGPVLSDLERLIVDTKAKMIAGMRNVDNGVHAVEQNIASAT